MAELAEASGSVHRPCCSARSPAPGRCRLPRCLRGDHPRHRGVGVEPSLRAFAAGIDKTLEQLKAGKPSQMPKPASAGKRFPELAPVGDAQFDALVAQGALPNFPTAAWHDSPPVCAATVDFQDVAYGREYLDLVAQCSWPSSSCGEQATYPLRPPSTLAVANGL